MRFYALIAYIRSAARCDVRAAHVQKAGARVYAYVVDQQLQPHCIDACIHLIIFPHNTLKSIYSIIILLSLYSSLLGIFPLFCILNFMCSTVYWGQKLLTISLLNPHRGWYVQCLSHNELNYKLCPHPVSPSGPKQTANYKHLKWEEKWAPELWPITESTTHIYIVQWCTVCVLVTWRNILLW